MFSDLSSKAIHHLSNLSAGYYAPLWVPVATQLTYRWARYNMYRNMFKLEHFKEGSPEVKQRNAQYRLFNVLAGVKILTFLALSSSNNSYLIPACYTLAHLVWTIYCKSREKMVQDPHSSQRHWSSMDKLIPIR